MATPDRTLLPSTRSFDDAIIRLTMVKSSEWIGWAVDVNVLWPIWMFPSCLSVTTHHTRTNMNIGCKLTLTVCVVVIELNHIRNPIQNVVKLCIQCIQKFNRIIVRERFSLIASHCRSVYALRRPLIFVYYASQWWASIMSYLFCASK